METGNLLLLVIVMTGLAWLAGHHRAVAIARPLGGIRALHSLPVHFAMRSAIWCAAPALGVLAIWLALADAVIIRLVLAELPATVRPDDHTALQLTISQIRNVASGSLPAAFVAPEVAQAAERLNVLRAGSARLLTGIVLALGVLGATLAWLRVSVRMRAREQVERTLRTFFLLCATVAVMTTAGIVFSVLFESLEFFRRVPVTEFLFGLKWSPQTALRADQVAAEGAFGAVPLFAGTLLISLIALLVAVPVGLMSAIYLAEYASARVRAWVKPALEILAGVPTVVYGFFAALTVAPSIRQLGESMGLSVSSESALAAGLVMGIMIIPFVSSLADDVITAVPRALRDASLALGATRSETVRRVVLPAALPGIMGGVLLAASRAIGETMIVVMAAGLAANLTANPLDAVTTVTVQIVTLLTGDQEFDSAKTLAAFALGLVLFVTTLAMNVLALHIVRRYREQYE